ncbi:centromere protein O-like [Lingula anatina]|uniref:Centromere protein O n=1 Tax=Lingula anatina TaxID=7574 RepID=A0A1S3HVR9_LINAN|nr:centromere protein O-like [Lingula anatina]|eukprot:XP_013389159.1 centromere protein O-like [Lingula anatina]
MGSPKDLTVSSNVFRQVAGLRDQLHIMRYLLICSVIATALFLIIAALLARRRSPVLQPPRPGCHDNHRAREMGKTFQGEKGRCQIHWDGGESQASLIIPVPGKPCVEWDGGASQTALYAQQNTLEMLQDLETKSKKESSLKEEEKKQDDELRQLKLKVTKLQQKKKWLQQQLSKESPLQQVDINNIDSLDREEKSELLDAAYAAQQKKLEEMVVLHRLTGISIDHIKPEAIRICWDTSYGGEFFEAFYAEVTRSRDKLTVQHHSLPYFLPINSLITRHLNTDITVFAEMVSRYLNVFVEKRQEAVNAEKEFGLYMSKPIAASPSCDVIEFSLKPTMVPGKLHTQLFYSDLLQPLPTEVEVEWRGEEGVLSREDIFRVKQIFLSKSLCSALEELVTKV